MGEASAATESAAGGITAGFKSAGESMKSAGMALLPLSAASAVALGESIKWAEEQQKATSELQKAVDLDSAANDKNVTSLLAQANALSKVTEFSKTEFIQSDANLAIHKMSQDQIESLTPRLADLAEGIAVATGSQADLGAASKMVSKAIGEGDTEGFAGALRRAGVFMSATQKEILKTGDEQQKLGVVTDLLKGHFDGLAVTAGDTTAGKMKIMQHSIEEAGVSIGVALLPFVEKVAAAISDWADKFQHLDPHMQKFIVALLAVTAVAAPLLIFLGSLAAAIATLADPVALAAAALGAAAVFIIAHWGQIVAFWNSQLKPAFDAIWQAVQPLVQIIGVELALAFKVLSDIIANEVWPWIEQHKQQLIILSAIITGVWIGALLASIAVFVAIVGAVLIVIDIIGKLIGWFEKLPQSFASATGSLSANAQKMWSDLTNAFSKGVATVLTFFERLPEAIVVGLAYMAGRLVRFSAVDIPNFVSSSINWFVNFAASLPQLVGQAVGSIEGWLAKLPGVVGSYIGNAYHTAVNWFNNMVGAAQGAGSQIVGGVTNYLWNIPGTMWSVLQTAWSHIGHWAGQIASALGDLAAKAWDAFKKGMGISSPGHIERAFMAMSAQSFQSVRDIEGNVSKLSGLMEPLGNQIPGGGSGQAAVVAGGAGGGITINVQGGTFIGAGGVQEVSALIYKELQRQARANGFNGSLPNIGLLPT